MPLRVLHVSQPVSAGVPTVAVAVVRAQVSGGHEVHVACPPGPGLAEWTAATGAQHHAWPAQRSPVAGVLDEARRLRRIVADVDPDVVVLHSAKAGLVGRLVLRGARPTVYVPHAWSFEAVTGRTAAVATAWEVLSGRWTDVVVCVSDDERRRGCAAGVTAPMTVVPNGVDVQARVPSPAPAARARLGLAERPTVVCLGRLAEQKGQDLLLAAWPAVRAAVPDAQLVLVGDGPQRPALEALATDDVVFAGTREDAGDFLAAADVVALPSRWESTPLVSLEAMASGRPVVAFEVDGLRASFGDTGVILAQGDVDGMAAAITGWLTDPARAAAAGTAARERVVAVADLRTGLARWDRVIADAAARRAPEELTVTVVPRLLRALAGGLARTDVGELPGGTRTDAVRAAALSSLGVPVLWRGGPVAPRALGAPVITDPAVAAVAARRPGLGAVDGPPVSVVVTVLDEGEELRRLVADLAPQLRDGDELIVVDGGSTDGSLEGLPAAPGLHVEVVPGAGISAGRNIGVKRAHNDVIVCTDAGCVPDPRFVDAFRRAFSGDAPPAMVSGVYRVLARNPLERAQALACYPQPAEVRRPSLLVRTYTAVFGTGFDPRFAVGRCVAFTRAAWSAVGGFPEHLATGEDVSFGLAVAEHGEVQASTDAVTGWTQRDGLAATWRMYRGYGRASTGGGHRSLLVRDGVRGLAYVVAPLVSLHPRGRRLVVAGVAAYLSLPVRRALREHAGPAAVAMLPVALATKDLGKLAGAAQGLARRRRTRRSS